MYSPTIFSHIIQEKGKAYSIIIIIVRTNLWQTRLLFYDIKRLMPKPINIYVIRLSLSSKPFTWTLYYQLIILLFRVITIIVNIILHYLGYIYNTSLPLPWFIFWNTRILPVIGRYYVNHLLLFCFFFRFNIHDVNDS